MKVEIIAIGCDHAGFPYKASLIRLLKRMGILVNDMGTNSEASVDYPDFIHPVAEAVEKGKAQLGIVLCGSGNGAAMTANKHQKIRAAICWNERLAELARQHNDANVLSIPVRFISLKMARKITKAFLITAFEGGRHAKRVAKVSCA
jgi:ribose 5-phosphate isomerase B